MRKICILLFFIVSCSYSYSQQNKDILSAIDSIKLLARKADKSIDKLALAIAPDSLPEYQRARNIYLWIIGNINYDFRSFLNYKSSDDDPQKVVHNKKTTCLGYSHLFESLCTQSHLQCITLEGYTRGYGYYPGKKAIYPDHAWNAVKINNLWYIVDATWGNGYITSGSSKMNRLGHKLFHTPEIKDKKYYVFSPSWQYFLPEPGKLILTHLPVDPVWQLLDCSIPIDSFEKDTLAILNALACKKANIAYTDSANTFLTLPQIRRDLISALRALDFNHTNLYSISAASTNYGCYLFEIADKPNADTLKWLKDLQHASFWLNKAKNYSNSEKTQIKDYHQQNIAELNKKFKGLLRENNGKMKIALKSISSNEKNMERSLSRKEFLNNHIFTLASQNDNLRQEDKIFDVQRKVTESDGKKEAIVTQFLQSLRLNNDTLVQIRKDIEQMMNSENADSLAPLTSLRLEIIPLLKEKINLTQHNREILDSMDPFSFYIINDNNLKYSQINDSIYKINQASYHYDNVVFKQTFKELKIKYSEIARLMKNNKKLLIEAKKNSMDDRDEEAMYLTENQNYVDDNMLMIDKDDQEIKNIDDYNSYLKKENTILNEELVQIEKENDIEKSLLLAGLADEKSRYSAHNKRNAYYLKMASKAWARCNKALNDLNKLMKTNEPR
jgi:hypothetical protein